MRRSLIALALCLAGLQAATITVRADPWPPFNDEPGSELEGYAVELMRAIFEPAGHQVDYRTMPWARALASLEQGGIVAAIGATTEDIASDQARFPKEPIGHVDDGFYVRGDSDWRYTGVTSLDQVRLGYIKDYGYNEDISAWISRANGNQAQAATGDDALERNIAKLRAGRIDAIIETPVVMNWTLRALRVPANEIVFAGTHGQPLPVYVVFNRTDPASESLARLWDEQIAAMRQDGRLATVLEKYGQKDWAAGAP